MMTDDEGTVVVIFVSQRTAADPAGYDAAAARMDALAAAQPGYRGVDSVRDAAGLGITISRWADAASAAAWRDHPDHVAIRERGRALWYDWYEVTVSETTRAYRWTRAGSSVRPEPVDGHLPPGATLREGSASTDSVQTDGDQ